MRPLAIERWHAMLADRNPSILDELLDENVRFESPVVHTPQDGRAKATFYLRAAELVLNNGTMRYVAEWFNERSAVLEFNAEIDGIVVDGVDMIWWNEHDRIVRFKVMVRPLKAINTLHQRMGEALDRLARGG